MTVEYHELQRELERINEELRILSNKLFEEERWKSNAELQVSTWGDEPVEAKVNWCALGSVGLAEASAMAQLLTTAADEAKNFKYNGYKVTI